MMQQLMAQKRLLVIVAVGILIGGLIVTGLYLLVRSHITASPRVTTCAASPEGNKLVVIVQGIGTMLSSADVKSNGGYGDTSGFQPIENALRCSKEFSHAQFMVYSYSYKSGNGGKPQAYTCDATFDQLVSYDSLVLRSQIEDYANLHPDSQVYIVAHSLGGVIAFSFLSSLVEDQHSLALPNGGNLKGVAVMDSPLGGVVSTPGFNTTIQLRKMLCGDFSTKAAPAVDNLQALYSQMQGALIERGVNASIYFSLLHNGTGVYMRNEDISVAAMNMGLQFVDIGNEYDLLYRPNVCNVGVDFVSSEFEGERVNQANSGSLFVRAFQSGSLNVSQCIEIPVTQLHHGDVLTQSNVQKLICEVFEQEKVDQLVPVLELPRYN